ncbi:MAG: arylesterase [Pseudomonadota bacterium]|nr:arylesterase [Pseudomonadota bacterium]
MSKAELGRFGPAGHHAMQGLQVLYAVLTAILLTVFVQAAKADDTIVIVAYGDSLTAGYGLKPGEAFPDRLQKALRAKGYKVIVQNAGVSGETTAGGLARLDWATPSKADAVILELGANDALRALDPIQAKENLDKMILAFKKRGLDILLAGMKAPPNYGPEYAATFDAIYPELAENHGLLLYPFFLDATMTKKDMSLPDGLHPSARGVDAIVAAILPDVEKLIARVKVARTARPRG